MLQLNRGKDVIPMAVNREYKDRLFTFIFGNPDNKQWTLNLYNAINDSHYTNPEDIRLNTIEDAVYMSMKNDVSFLIADTLNLYEQQSSFNPNMPIRFFIYAGMVYAKYVEENRNYHRYSTKQQKIPTPKCICFYNGKDAKNDKIVLSLSDAFDTEAVSDIEVKVTMLNINFGHNRELMEKCRPLEDYAKFVDCVRVNQKTAASLEEAIDEALNELEDESPVKAFLIANKAEVKNMCITEYDEERTLAELREECLEEGMKKGIKKGIQQGMTKGKKEGKFDMLAELVSDGLLTLAQAAEKAQMSIPEFQRRMSLPS